MLNQKVDPIPQEPSIYLKWMFFLAILSIFAGLGLTPLIDLDEGAFTAATQEMVLRGNYLHTYLNGEPRYDKPILIYWLQAASATTFGFQEWALRLPSALAGLGWMLVVYHAVSLLYDRTQAMTAAIITASAIGTTFIFKLAIADALLNLFIATAVLAQFIWYQKGPVVYRWVAYGAMGLGFLTKGPIAVLLPGASMVIFLISVRNWQKLRDYVFDFKGWAILSIIALPWYVAVTSKFGPEFVINFIMKHNVGRFTGEMGAYHNYGYLYYLPVILILLMPYTGLLISAFKNLRQQSQDHFSRYAIILFAITFTLFTFSSNKLPHYIIYGLSALLVTFGLSIGKSQSRWLLSPFLISLIIAFTIPTVLDYAKDNANTYYQTLLSDIDEHFGMLYVAVISICIAIGIWMVIDQKHSIGKKLIGQGVLSSFIIGLLLLPAIGNVSQGSIKRAGMFASQTEGPLKMHGINTPSFSIYAERLVTREAPVTGDIVLATRSSMNSLNNYTILFEDKNIVLARIDD